jgi:hypothetical protein
MNLNIIKNKSILFLSPSFFNYEKLILDRLMYYHSNVIYYNIRLTSKIILKGIFKILPFLFQFKANNLYKRIINENYHNKFDFVFIIKPYLLSKSTLLLLKNHFNSAKFILYLWDSVKNSSESNLSSIFGIFDSVFTFDSFDAERYKINFLPLFYSKKRTIDIIRKKSPALNKINIKRFDVSYIGTIHSDKLNILFKVERIFNQYKLNFFSYKFLHTKFHFLLKRITNPYFWFYKMKNINFKPMDYDKVLDTFFISDCVFDIHHLNQSGLTMRTFECLGLRKKLITTNFEVINYDFYSSKNILIIDRQKPSIPLSFFTEPADESKFDILKRYELSNWLITIFS